MFSFMKRLYKWEIQSNHGFGDFYDGFPQVVNMYANVSILGKHCLK